MNHMTQTDLMSWRMESDPILRSTIVAVALLDRPPDRPRFVDMMERGTSRIPVFRRTVRTNRWSPTPPRWTDDPDFDLNWHLRRLMLPPGSGWAEVLDFARVCAMTAFDTARPLWEFTVLEGLDDGRAALVMKVHHSLTDGVGGMQITREIVDFDREGDRHDGGHTDSSRARTGAPPSSMTRQIAHLARHPMGGLRTGLATSSSVLRLTRPALRTLSPVMTARSTRRHVAVLDVPVHEFDRAANEAEGSVNDAFLAAVLLGMARYHRRHRSAVPELRITLPISLRTEHDPLGGNRITLARFTLPADVDDPVELVHEVHTTVGRWRNEPALALSPAIAGALNLLPASALGSMLKHVDFVASNVAGSPVPLFTAGAEILRFYAFSPTLGSAFNVTLLSYTSRYGIGVDADAAAVPDLDDLMRSLAEGFRDVLGICPTGPEVPVVFDPTVHFPDHVQHS